MLEKALKHLMPLGGYSITDGKVTVHEDGKVHGYKKPTQAQIDAAIKEVEAVEYQNKRAAEYPPVGEQLDAILKGFNQLRLNGTDMPEDLDRILSLWLEVKKKYPKGR